MTLNSVSLPTMPFSPNHLPSYRLYIFESLYDLWVWPAPLLPFLCSERSRIGNGKVRRDSFYGNGSFMGTCMAMVDAPEIPTCDDIMASSAVQSETLNSLCAGGQYTFLFLSHIYIFSFFLLPSFLPSFSPSFLTFLLFYRYSENYNIFLYFSIPGIQGCGLFFHFICVCVCVRAANATK